jgi:2-succinyl-6-hydroxy-2,4-cyclohexadiene-1-carboxylate synthase
LINYNYITRGNKKKPALVFLHGFLGSSQDWLKIISDLSSDYYCLAVDLPGHGKSLIPEKYSDLNLHNVALTINDYLKNLNLIKPVLIGYSMGGRIALHMLGLDEQYWQGAILESASPGIESPANRAIRRKQDFALATRLENDDFNQFLIDWYNQPLFSGYAKLPDFEKILMQRLQNNPLQISMSLRAFSTGNQESFWPRLSKFKVPMLMIAGSDDEKYSKIVNQISTNFPNIKTQIIPRSGHVVHAEQPSMFSLFVSEFANSIFSIQSTPFE